MNIDPCFLLSVQMNKNKYKIKFVNIKRLSYV